VTSNESKQEYTILQICEERGTGILLMPLVGGGAALLALGLTPVCIRVAKHYGIVAKPPTGGSKLHLKPMPTAGGLAICAAVLVAGTMFVLLYADHIGSIGPMVTIGVGATAMCAAGLLDDLARLPWFGKMAIQMLAACAIIAGGVHLQVLALAICLPLSVIWIVGVTNAVNLIDGMDGLAAGISLIAAASLAIIAWTHGASNVAMLAAAVCGASGGYLVYNFYPAKTFTGDAGSLFLGFVLAAMTLAMVTTPGRLSILFAGAIALGIPIFDTLSCMVRRTVHRESVFGGDLGHYYNQAITRYGLSQRTVALGSYAVGAVLGVLAVLSSFLAWPQALAVAVLVYLLLTIAYWQMGFIAYEEGV